MYPDDFPQRYWERQNRSRSYAEWSRLDSQPIPSWPFDVPASASATAASADAQKREALFLNSLKREKRRWARKRERKLARKRKRANPTISEIVKEDPGDAMRAHAGPASASGTAASSAAQTREVIKRERERANPTMSEAVKEDPGDAMRAHARPASASGTAASADAHPNASGVKKCKRERASPLICNM